jgi:ribose transport system ATP-binding protein
METPISPQTLLEFRRVGKCFGANRVLEDVSFDLREGEVHILAGENGAGKSTLIKILGGVHAAYEGSIWIRGRPVRFASPREANEAGVSVIHQEMSLVDSMSVLDNIHLGRERARLAGLLLDRREQEARALDLLGQLDIGFSAGELRRPVGEFPLPVKNLIEIAKALACDARILVMDEPTSALSKSEVERLFALVDRLKRRGCGIIYITHRMEEIYRVADRITVLRDGRRVGTAGADECPEATLIQWMIGRELAAQEEAPAPREGRGGPAPVLEVEGLSVPHPDPGRPPAVSDLSLSVRPGEVVGIAGVQGSGASELFSALFGAHRPACTGKIRLDGKPFIPRSPGDSVRRGLAHLTADRKGTGLVPAMGAGHNITLASLPRTSPWGVLSPRREAGAAARQVRSLGIRLASLDQPVSTLSGGNQQKVVLAKWLEAHPKVLLLEEPTRGVDIGAKSEIYSLMRGWSAAGMAILVTSSELPELLLLSDRVLALHRGALTGQFSRGDATAAGILAAAMGSRPGEGERCA